MQKAYRSSVQDRIGATLVFIGSIAICLYLPLLSPFIGTGLIIGGLVVYRRDYSLYGMAGLTAGLLIVLGFIYWIVTFTPRIYW